MYGSRPGKKVAGWYGSVMGAYLVSVHMHLVMIWGLGRGPELLHTAGFFVMLGVGTIFEKKWKEWTGKPVVGVFGSLWTTFWHLIRGSGMVDAFVRRGIVANDFVPKQMRVGKAIVDVVLAVVASVRSILCSSCTNTFTLSCICCDDMYYYSKVEYERLRQSIPTARVIL